MTETDLDLAAYLRRIGYEGPREPSLPVLRAIVAAQATSIPFDNLDVLLGFPIRLDPATLERKLVRERRGGYCFELNTLLLHALQAMGFPVAALAARVLWGRPEGVLPPRTHMLLRVDLPEGPYLADVGFGGSTPTAPLAFVLGVEQATPLEPFRLVPVGAEIDLQIRRNGEWLTLYRLSPEEQLPVDREMANWFVATHPESIFRQRLMAARPTGLARHGLLDGEHTVRFPDGGAERRLLTDGSGILDALAARFRIVPRHEEERRAWLRVLDPLARRTAEATAPR